MSEATANAAIDVRNLREFFRDSVHDALLRQHVGVDDHTEHYVVNLLTMFSRSEALFEQTHRRRRVSAARPDAGGRRRGATRRSTAAARCSGSAMSRCSSRASSRRASRAGSSTSITTSRWAVAPTARSPTPAASGTRGRALGAVFAELAEKFQRLVDALNDVSEMAHAHDRPRRAAAVRDLAQDRQPACPRRSCAARRRADGSCRSAARRTEAADRTMPAAARTAGTARRALRRAGRRTTCTTT